MMFCNECGASIADGSKFCNECGSHMPGASGQTTAPGDERGSSKKGGAGFFSTPAGIVLIVIIGVAVLGGIVLGIVFAVKGGSGSTNEGDLAKVWDEYQTVASEADAKQAKITLDTAALTKAQEDLKNSQTKVQALQKVLKKTPVPTSSKWKEKYEQLADTLATYDTYVTKSNDLYGTLGQAIANNTLSTQRQAIDATLSDLKTLASKLKDLMSKFLENNSAVTVAKTDEAFNPQTVIDRTSELEAKVNKATGTTGQQQTTPSTPAESKPSSTSTKDYSGTYTLGTAGIVFNSDGTWALTGTTLTGTYTVSGNTITMTEPSSGAVTTGTMEDGVFLYGGDRYVKQ